MAAKDKGRQDGKFRAVIFQEFIGSFEDEVEAARAYDARARALGHPEWCNFCDDEAAGSYPKAAARVAAARREVAAKASAKAWRCRTCGKSFDELKVKRRGQWCNTCYGRAWRQGPTAPRAKRYKMDYRRICKTCGRPKGAHSGPDGLISPFGPRCTFPPLPA